jgi:hypothetical protein
MEPEEIKRIEAETRKLNAEFDKVQAELIGVRRTNKWFYFIAFLKVFIWAALTFITGWFYVEKVIVPLYMSDNYALRRENQKHLSELNERDEQSRLKISSLQKDLERVRTQLVDVGNSNRYTLREKDSSIRNILRDFHAILQHKDQEFQNLASRVGEYTMRDPSLNNASNQATDQPRGIIRGKVEVRKNGRYVPVRGIKLIIVVPAAHNDFINRSTLSASDGTFEFTQIPLGLYSIGIAEESKVALGLGKFNCDSRRIMLDPNTPNLTIDSLLFRMQ